MGLLTFLGGIHPYEGKELSMEKPVREYLPKGDCVYPLSQHIGAPATPIVKKGDRVLVGQKIAETSGFVSANIHSSISGKVKAIEPRYVPGGSKVESIVVENDGLFEEIDFAANVKDLSTLYREDVKEIIKEAGIVGMGGAGFPANVKLAAQYCDGTILMPGESFSYNLGVGELTEERGFLPGPSYADGQSVMDMGGGICQVSSTMYMACLYANLEIDERHCHPYPSSYVPAGLDATVAWGGCDFVFTNDTDYPIKISTSYDGYSTSCTIWGTITEPFSVELYTETVETEPYETKYELDKSLGKDEQVLDTVGIEGLTVQSYRRVYDGDGNVISDNPEAISVYSKRDEVYKVGKLPKDKDKDKDKDQNKDKSDSSDTDKKTTESESDTQEE